MCGIAGIINGGSESSLMRMVHIQAHRGPDDWGMKWFHEHQSGLGHRRLSILDLSAAGHQPMANMRGTRWITFNGEIYNYLELRRDLERKGYCFRSATDTEVILAAYDEWGPECVRRFNGMFAFGIYDEETRDLFIARDHLGVKPLYYAQRGETFAFASESKAIFEVDGFERSVDIDAVASTLMLLWIPEPESGFTDINKLMPGHYGVFRNGRLTTTEYWDIPLYMEGDHRERSEEEYVEELREILERSVRRQMIADVPVGAFLSGGLDSSLIVALMRRVTSGKISTHTIEFSDRDKRMEAMSDDAHYASIIAQQFDTEHSVIEVDSSMNRLLPKLLWHLDDPIADGAAINTYMISKSAKERGTTVLLSGMGGDEVFGGYRKQLATLYVRKYHMLPPAMRRRFLEPLVEALPVAIGGKGLWMIRWAKRFMRSVSLSPLDAFIYGFAYFTREELRCVLAAPYNEIPFDDLYPIRRYRAMARRAEGASLVSTMTYLDSKLFLPGLNLAYSDKAAMAASVETRPPLIDIEVVDFMARLPDRYKINGRTQKYLLKRAAEAYLPKEVIYRPKAPFGTPIRSWMNAGLDKNVRRLFTRGNPRVEKFINPKVPITLLDEHISGRKDNAHRLWSLYVLGVWLQMHQPDQFADSFTSDIMVSPPEITR